jgi:hypothetical protein
MQEADHHIGHLHAGVVDVVLHVDFLPGGAQQADEGVAENGVAQVADVRGLVGIDAGVLDKRMQARTWPRQGLLRGNHAHACRAVEARIDVAGAGDFKAGEAFERAQRGDNLLRDDLGRLAQLAGQLEGDGRGQLAELQVGRNLQRNGFKLKIVLFLQNALASPSRFCNSRYTSVCLKNP